MISCAVLGEGKALNKGQHCMFTALFLMCLEHLQKGKRLQVTWLSLQLKNGTSFVVVFVMSQTARCVF